MEKIAILFNPKSGKNKKNNQKINQLKQELDKKYTCTVYMIEEHHDIQTYTVSICEKGYDLLIGCGGDGTINHIINGLMKSQTKCKFAIYPIGTANDYGKSLGMTKNVKRFVQIIEKEEFKSIDLGHANDKYFINVAACGVIADIGFNVPKIYKKRFGKFGYYIYGAFKFNKIIKKTTDLKIQLDDQEINAKVLFFIVTKTPYVAGFRNILPLTIENNDGYLHLVMVEKVKLFELIDILYNLIVVRKINHNKVTVAKSKKIAISPNNDEKISIDLDGEFGGHLPVTLTVYSKVVDILVG
jgi:diacylglycerol kinase (ATP)